MWPFVGGKYSWTPDGTHKFFGWLHTDVNMNPDQTASAFFGANFQFDANTKTLTIPAVSMLQNTPQFDFMYSNIYERNLDTDPDYVSPVPLEFSHLFTAFSVAAQNVSTTNEITLESISIEGLRNNNSATINFSGANAVVNYGTGTNNNPSAADYTFTPQMKLGTNLFDVSSKTNASQSRQYFLTWPMSGEEVAAVKFTITYTLAGETTPITKTINLSETAWQPGAKNNVNLAFKDKEIILQCIVMDWNVEEEIIDFSDQVTVSGTMEWDPDTVRSVDYDTGEVILFDDTNIQATCTFHIDTPQGATWTAALIPMEGHQDAFEFVESTKYGAVGGDSVLKLVVTNQAPIAPRHVCKLLITVQTADGRTIVVKNLVPEGKSYTEFKVIQNLING